MPFLRWSSNGAQGEAASAGRRIAILAEFESIRRLYGGKDLKVCWVTLECSGFPNYPIEIIEPSWKPRKPFSHSRARY
jgi:hypothetical protein